MYLRCVPARHLQAMLSEWLIPVYVLVQDNVFSREVSLNDLNTLHIGCELEGPLAFRLDQNSPRFITRYRAILAELHRVSSAQDAERNSPPPTRVLPC